MSRPAGAFDPQPTLTGERVELRPLRAGDYGPLYRVASDPLVWKQHPARDRYLEPVFRALFDESLASGGALAIVDRRTGEIIGSSRYHGYDPAAREVEIGWTYLARAYWGGTWNGEVKQLMLAHAFRAVDRVIFKVAPQNLRSPCFGEDRRGARRGGPGRYRRREHRARDARPERRLDGRGGIARR